MLGWRAWFEVFPRHVSSKSLFYYFFSLSFFFPSTHATHSFSSLEYFIYIFIIKNISNTYPTKYKLTQNKKNSFSLIKRLRDLNAERKKNGCFLQSGVWAFGCFLLERTLPSCFAAPTPYTLTNAICDKLDRTNFVQKAYSQNMLSLNIYEISGNAPFVKL